MKSTAGVFQSRSSQTIPLGRFKIQLTNLFLSLGFLHQCKQVIKVILTNLRFWVWLFDLFLYQLIYNQYGKSQVFWEWLCGSEEFWTWSGIVFHLNTFKSKLIWVISISDYFQMDFSFWSLIIVLLLQQHTCQQMIKYGITNY